MKIRVVDEGDLSPLVGFLTEGFPATPAEQWRRLLRVFWDENPAFSADMVKGWVLEDDGNKIGGFVGSVPFRYWVEGAAGLSAASAGWYVRPDLRGMSSLKLMRTFLTQTSIDLFLSTTPNELAVKLLTRMGFTRVPLPFRQTEYWLVVDWPAIIDLAARSLLPSLPPRISRLLARPAAPLGRLLGHSARAGAGLSGAGLPRYDFAPCRACDPSFTTLWEQNKSRFSTTLYRDAQTLNWLYFSEITAPRRYVTRCGRSGNPGLLGYFVYDLRQLPGTTSHFLQLKDFFAPGLDRSFVLEFLGFSRRLAETLGAAAVHIWPQDEVMNGILARELKIRRKLNWPYLAKWNAQKRGAKCVPAIGDHVPSPIEPDRGFS